MEYVLALDQGTTSSRAIIFDRHGNIVGSAQQEFRQIYPHNGWVEHDPTDILGSQVGVIGEALVRANITGKQIKALGITNQRETTIVWDKDTGKPVYNAIVWQCRRTAGYCEQLKKDGLSDLIYQKTGLIIDAYFSATKISWILDNVSGAREKAESGKLLFGTVDTYLLWVLSGGEIFATDYSNASRTMLFNIHTLDWDDELLALFNIPRAMLPSVHPSSYLYGYTDPAIIGYRIPVCGVAGDQQAALFGQLCTEKGTVKNTYGTGCFLLMNTGNEAVASKNGLITSLAAGVDEKPQYVLEGSVFIGGAVIKWLRDGLRMIRESAETEQHARAVADNGGVYVVPAFVGLGAPYWQPQVRGTITGITRATKREHLIRAALESIAYQVHDIFRAMEEDLGRKISCLAVDGGACVNDFLMQFQADILDVRVVRPKRSEVTALGAAYLAGLNSGYWCDIEDIRRNVGIEREFLPAMEEADREKLLAGWKRAVKAAMAAAE
ncbi:MAG TPA: glycerol kinase GlpK [Acholeplasmataceae bacterium]|jgi:glycerol kinase|nr:glycerol kinase GlpK [Acholeplasmataceae bacterium]